MKKSSFHSLSMIVLITTDVIYFVNFRGAVLPLSPLFPSIKYNFIVINTMYRLMPCLSMFFSSFLQYLIMLSNLSNISRALLSSS